MPERDLGIGGTSRLLAGTRWRQMPIESHCRTAHGF